MGGTVSMQCHRLFWPNRFPVAFIMHSSDLALALVAANRAAGSQQYPAGSLYVVATPIGNLADITLRALHVLSLVDIVACEDTRRTVALLGAYGIVDKPLLALHQHNEMTAAQDVLARLRAGQRVACVSDAGTPAVSDPGARLVAACRAADLRVVPLPGASSVTTALSAAGIMEDAAFVFAGFLPPKAQACQEAVHVLAAESRAVVLLEAPHRILRLAQALAALGTRPVTVARELTKQFEQIHTLPCDALADWLSGAHGQNRRGEFVLILHPAPPLRHDADDLRVLRLLLAELPINRAVRLAAQVTGAARNELYAAALALRRGE